MCAPCGLAMARNWMLSNNGKQIADCTFSGCTDDIHPSDLTQYTNACLLYAIITGRSPIGLDDAGSGVTNVTMLQETVGDYCNL
jgi:hypothetical protein